MGETLKQKQPFSVWYVRELENYLSDMAKEGKRFIGRNRFEKCENKQITYRIMHGPAELDQALLDGLQAQNWFYAGDINRIGNPKTFGAPDQALGGNRDASQFRLLGEQAQEVDVMGEYDDLALCCLDGQAPRDTLAPAVVEG